MIVFDDAQLSRQRRRAAPRMQEHDFLLAAAWQEIHDRISLIKRTFNAPYLLSARDWKRPEKNSEKITGPLSTLSYDGMRLSGATPETQPDLILSCFDLHTINDLPGLLLQIRQTLQPDGVFIAALPGGETLHQLRISLTAAELDLRGGVSPRIFPFIDKQQMGALMQRAGFALPVVDSDMITVDYTSLPRLLHDLRYMGEGNAIAARDRHIPPRALFTRTAEIYQAQFGTPAGHLPATFEIIYLIGWGPSATQQKPLKPGSAQMRLADALNTKEIGASDYPAPTPTKS